MRCFAIILPKKLSTFVSWRTWLPNNNSKKTARLKNNSGNHSYLKRGIIIYSYPEIPKSPRQPPLAHCIFETHWCNYFQPNKNAITFRIWSPPSDDIEKESNPSNKSLYYLYYLLKKVLFGAICLPQPHSMQNIKIQLENVIKFVWF